MKTVSAQRKSQTRPKPVATPEPKGPPTSLITMGEPPPVPKRKPTPEPELTAGDTISVDTTEILLPVTVRDSSGKLVSNLTRNDFRVFEDAAQQPLSDLALRQVPVDAVLMVDSSSSTASNLDDFRRAAEGFASRLATEDRISLIKFDDRVEVLQDWTQSRFQFKRALNRIEPGMFTRFNDALLLAAKEQFTTGKSRRAVIVLSDGIDNGNGVTTLASALQALLKAQVTVYVVSNTEIARTTKKAALENLLGGSPSALQMNQLEVERLRQGLQVLDYSEQKLEQIAEATGGRLYKPESFEGLEAVYAEVAEELRHQYALYYTPLNRAHDGGFRRVRVDMANPGYRATTRIGYFAPGK
ncbi:MAG TPA: VWA domain-containing protein [Pyrinomonadaceae bacterium]